MPLPQGACRWTQGADLGCHASPLPGPPKKCLTRCLQAQPGRARLPAGGNPTPHGLRPFAGSRRRWREFPGCTWRGPEPEARENHPVPPLSIGSAISTHPAANIHSNSKSPARPDWRCSRRCGGTVHGPIRGQWPGPPFHGFLVIAPALSPVFGIPAKPPEIAQRFLHFHPDAVLILGALDVTHHFFQCHAGFSILGGIGSRGGGLDAPQGVG